MFGRSLKCAGVKLTRRSNPSHPVDESFFDEWNQLSAYVIGFFYADGAFEHGKTFRLYSGDYDLLLEMGKAMKLERRVEGPYKRNYRLTLNSQRLYTKLLVIVGAKRKLGDVQYPETPKDVEADFIRGFFDGDGHVGLKKSLRGAPVVSFSNTSHDFMIGLVEALERNGFRCGNLTIQKRGNPNHNTGYYLEIRNWTMFDRFADFFYGHNPELYLKRKRDRFEVWHPNPKPLRLESNQLELGL